MRLWISRPTEFQPLWSSYLIEGSDHCRRIGVHRWRTVFRRTPRDISFSIRVRAGRESDSVCLPRSGQGSDESVSVIVVPGWLRRSSVRGGAGVARFARSSRIWAGIIPQGERETTGSPAIAGYRQLRLFFRPFRRRRRVLENGRDDSRADNETLRCR